MGSNLGELLLREKLINSEQLKSASEFQVKNEIPMGTAIVSLGLVSEEEMAQALSRQFGYPYIDLNQFEVYPDAVNLIPVDIAKKYMVIPVHRNKSSLTLAMVDPTDLECTEDIRFRTGLSLQPVIASESGIMNAIKKYYGSSDSLRVKEIFEEIERVGEADVKILEEEREIEGDYDYDTSESIDSTEEAPVITLVKTIFVDAIKKGASDVHFEPYERSFRVRYRIDGILHEMMKLDLKFKNPVLSRVKIISNMDIAEKRLPQDGRCKMKIRMEDGHRKEVDMRVSSVPTIFGEKIVVRLLDKEILKLDLSKLGFERETLELVKKSILRPWGIILVTGPTGSGKTHTLYSAISTLNSMEKNIMTAENPVEFYIPGINQIDIKDEIGLSFSFSLRSFLRQDPDIMLVGEMRDVETVDIAIKAAMTGHLVFSTVHTNDAARTIIRIINMGAEPFLIADSVILIVAQRLVRCLCKKCRVKHGLSPKALLEIGFKSEEIEKLKIYKTSGCGSCNYTGYRGRTGLFEVMEVTDKIKDLILARANSREIKAMALEQGMITLRQSGLIKVQEGITSIEEVLRETVSDKEGEK